MSARAAVVREHGNGMPDIGDFVAGRDGEVYRVVSLGRLETGRSPGAGMWATATVELADWSDVTDDNEPVCSCELDDDGEEAGES